MNRFSLSNFMAFVFVVCGVLFGMNEWAGATPPAAAGTQQLVFGNNFDPLEGCKNAVGEVGTTYGALISSCKKSGAGGDTASCSEKLGDCLDSDREELPISIGNMFNLTGGTPSQCSDLTRSEWESDYRNRKKDAADAKKDLLKAQKDAQKDQEDYQKQDRDLQKDMNQMIKDKNKADMDQKSQDRKDQAEQLQALQQVQKNIRDGENKVLATQNQLKQLALQRQMKVYDYQDAIIKCKLDAQKSYSDNSSILARQASSSSNAQGGSLIQQQWQNCVNRVLQARNTDADAYTAAVNMLNKALSDAQADVAAAHQQEQQMLQMQQQEASDKALKQTQDAQNYQTDLLQIVQQRQQLSQMMQQKMITNNQEIAQDQMEAYQASNDLSRFGNTPPKKTPMTDSQDAMGKYEGAYTKCMGVCKNVDGNDLTSQCSESVKNAQTSGGSAPGLGTK